MRWTSEDEPSVATVRTWVSPRVNRPEPWARGTRPTSTEIWRSSVSAAAVHPDALVEGHLAGGLLVDEVEQALADACLAASGFHERLAVAVRARWRGWSRRSASRSVLRRAGRSLREPDQQVGRRLGVRQGAMGLGQVDAEEARQGRRACSSRDPGSPRGRSSACRGSGPASKRVPSPSRLDRKPRSKPT